MGILNQQTELRGTAGVQGLCLQTRPADFGRSCQERRLATLPPARTLTLDLGSRQSILLGQPRDAPQQEVVPKARKLPNRMGSRSERL